MATNTSSASAFLDGGETPSQSKGSGGVLSAKSFLDDTSEISPDSGYGNELVNDFASEPERAWNQLKSDYLDSTFGQSNEQRQQLANAPIWDALKEQFHQTMASGKLPIDAFNLVMSPVMGTARAALANPIAHGMQWVATRLPGSEKLENEGKLPDQQQTEDSVMQALSLAMPKQGSVLASATGTPAVPTVAGLKSAARKLYSAVDNSGMRIKASSINDLRDTIKTELKSAGFNSKLMPRTQAALDEINAAADGKTDHSLQDIEILRRIAGHAAKSIEPSDRYMGRVIQDHIDDFVDNLGSQHLAGNAYYPNGVVDQTALKSLGEARDAWKRASKGEIIEGAIDKAHTNSSAFSASGYENALRSQFRKIANNDRAMRRFSKDEQDAIKHVAVGGTLENMLRFLGKFAVRGPGSAAVSLGGGAALGGPLGAATLPAIGEISRAGATVLTNRSANKAADLVLGGPKAATPATPLTPRVYAPLAGSQQSQPDWRPGTFDPQQ